MKVIRNINNNIAHCSDSKGREVIVFGKGIGFFRTGEEIPLNRINRTFYNIKDAEFGVLRTIPTVIINTAIAIVDYVSEKLSVIYPSATALVLADHLQFAIQRKDQNIYLAQPLIQDIMQLYPDEMQCALESLEIIYRMTGERLPRMEAGTLAMHFINDRVQIDPHKGFDTVSVIEQCTRIIEKHFSVRLDRESFNYSRFATHLDYLIRRIMNNEQIQSRNENLYDEMSTRYPDTMQCVAEISRLFEKKTGTALNKEEILYLVIHINRLISRI